MNSITDSKSNRREVLMGLFYALNDSRKAAPIGFYSLFIVTIILGIMPFLISYVNAQVIDEVVVLTTGKSALGQFSSYLILFIALAIGLQIFEQLLWALRGFVDRDTFYRISQFFTLKFLEKAATLDLYHYENAKTNDIIQKARESYDWRPGNMVDRLSFVFNSFVGIIASLGILLTFSPPLLLLLIFSTIPSITISLRAADEKWGVWDQSTETRRKYHDISNYLSSERSLMELRIFRTRFYLLENIRELFRAFNDPARKVARKKAFQESAAVVIADLGSLLIWVFAIYETLQGNITLGLLTFYAGSTREFSNNLQNIFRNLSYSYEDAKYMKSYYDFISLKNRVISGNKQLSTEKAPKIEFKNVDFTYPDSNTPVIKNLNLTIEPGERIAFVGENGAGKTTLVKLLARFYDIDSGSILIDGVELRELDLETWYRKLGVLFQRFVDYQFLPVRENISIGDIEKSSSLEEVKQAAHKSGAAEFIENLDNKYEQIVSKHYPHGTDLSGGQWQRIALARGFLRDAPVLILDEPTSAVDAKSEYEIFQRLYKFASDKTVIIISHRFATVRQADRICVFANGEIVEEGSHEELLALQGKYAEAFHKQAEGYR